MNHLNMVLAYWIRRKYKRFHRKPIVKALVECEEPCEGRLSRTVLWEGEGETPSLYSTYDPQTADAVLEINN